MIIISKSILSIVSVIGFILGIVALCCASTTPLSDNRPSITITPSNISYQNIKETADNKTEIQRKDYFNSLIGTRVRWEGTVKQITEDGTIYVDMGQGAFEGDIYLKGVPLNIAKTYNKGQLIKFEATIYSASMMLTYSISLNDPVVIP
jgi:hypothetical protein